MAVESDLSTLNIGGEGPVAPSPIPQSTPAPVASPQQTSTPALQPSATPGSGSTPSPSVLRSYAQEMGYDTSGFHDERELAAALFTVAQQYEQAEPLANIGRQFAPHADKWGAFQEWQKTQEAEQQKTAEAAAKEQAKPPFEWRTVEHDSAWEQHCERDPNTGRFVAKTLDGLQYAEKLNASADAMRYNSQDLLAHFPERVSQLVEAKLAEFQKNLDLDGNFERNWADRQNALSTDAWIQEREKDLFAIDANGQKITGPDGQLRPSPKGEALRGYAEELRASGTAEDKIRDYAWRFVEADAAAGKFGRPIAQSAAIPATEAAPIQPQRLFTRFAGNNSGRTQQRNGAPADPSAPLSDKNLSFRQIFDLANS